MLLICGLGNPGLKYKNSRHNLGFTVLDVLREELIFPRFEQKFSGLMSTQIVNDVKIVLFKPMLYMNQSGLPIKLLCDFYKIINLENILVIHDELELEFGKTKIKRAGGSSGHNGIRSIDSVLGKEYWRFKIGIGRPEFGEISAYVLSDFAPEQNIEKILNNIRLNASLILEKDKNILIQNYKAEDPKQ